ncbi:hypothetical protein MMC07_009713 [Pseudocyphellaria aurata]|nr:hypothetical protein [Pseudocyphellaria aurata]
MSRLIKVTSRPNFAPDHGRSAKGFNQESGQVYTETIARVGPMNAEWEWKTVGSSRLAKRFRSRGPGCASLTNMALRCAMVNSLSLTPESLKSVPWQIGQSIWNRIVASDLDSLRIWKVFASAYPGEDDETLNWKDHVILRPEGSFTSYITPLISPSFQWITFLTLSFITCSRTDLLQLSRLVNLGVLSICEEVSCSDIGLDDGIIRSWGRAAAESNAFSMLRVLNCRSQREITSRVLNYLNDFSSLAVFAVEDCNIGPQHKRLALSLGWQYKTGVDLSRFLVQAGATDSAWGTVIRACFRGSGSFSVQHVTAEGVAAVDALPVLHFSLGGTIPDAVVDVTGNHSMRTFHRVNVHVPVSVPMKALKRPGQISQSADQARKKPTMRSAKEQSMENMLIEFSS